MQLTLEITRFAEKLNEQLLAQGLMKEQPNGIEIFPGTKHATTFSKEDWDNWLIRSEKSYDVFAGFPTIQECIQNLVLPQSKYIVIHFYHMYYAVAFEAEKKVQIIGKYWSWYTEDYELKKCRTPPPNNHVEKRRKSRDSNAMVYLEMLALEPDIRGYSFRAANSNEFNLIDLKEYPNYLTMLGYTFKNEWFHSEESNYLGLYFKQYQTYFNMMTNIQGAFEINPFRRKVRYKNGDAIPLSVK